MLYREYIKAVMGAAYSFLATYYKIQTSAASLKVKQTIQIMLAQQ
jgi:hypothetical protein